MDKKTKINKNREYKRIYNRGKSFASPFLVTYAMKNKSRINRVGITTSKKIGNAVRRNRARRVIRAAYRELMKKIKFGYDIVFVARSKTCEVKMNDVLKSMTYHFEKLGVLE